MITGLENAILIERVSYENVILYNKIIDYFDKINYIDYYTDFINLLMDESSNKFGLGSELNYLFNKHINISSNLIGIELSFESHLFNKISVLDSIFSLNEIDKDLTASIASRLDIITDNSIDKFAVIINENTGLSDQEIFDTVDDIDNILIDNLIAILDKEDYRFDENSIIKEIKRKKLLTLMLKNNIFPNDRIGEFIKECNLNTDMYKMIKWYSNDVFSNNVNNAITTIITILLFSNTKKDNLVNTYYKIFENRIDKSILDKVSIGVVDFIEHVEDELSTI